MEEIIVNIFKHINFEISGLVGLVFFFIMKYLFKNFEKTFQTYTDEKAKNSATKEDINDITKIVEGIKNDHNIELTKLNSRLSIMSDREKLIFEEQRNVIIEFYITVCTGLSKYRSHNLETINNAKSVEEMKLYGIEIEKWAKDIEISISKMVLFFGLERKIIDRAKKVANEIENFYKLKKGSNSILMESSEGLSNPIDHKQFINKRKDTEDVYVIKILEKLEIFADSARDILENGLN